MKANTQPNCGPTAAAHILGQSVESVMAEYKSTFNHGSSWKGRTNWTRLCKYLSQAGVKSKAAPTGGSLNTWVENQTTKEGVYLVRVGDHFLAVKGRKIFDNHAENCDPANHWCKSKRVSHAVKIGATS